MQPRADDLQANEEAQQQQQQQQQREERGAMNGVSGSAGQGGGAQDDEPVLKYQRMGADVGKLLLSQGEGEDSREKKETVVRMAVHDSHLVRDDCCCPIG